MIQPHKIYVSNSIISGRGVFASSDIEKDEVLEECHFILLDKPYKDLGVIKDYVFSYPLNGRKSAVVCGFGMIYNHSYDSNATWEICDDKRLFRFKSLKDINKGDEIFIDYKTDNINFIKNKEVEC